MAMLTLFPPGFESGSTEPGLSTAAPLRGLLRDASLTQNAKALALYLAQTEVHTYAFSVAANVILSLFPFIVLMLTLARQVFHSPAMVAVIADEIRYFLPAGQDFVIRNMTILSRTHGGVQIASIVMLLISSTGVFIPLEVALNQVWGARKNRSYLTNQLVSLGLAFAIGTLTLMSISLTAAQHSLLSFLFLGNTDNVVFSFLAHWLLQISAAVISVLIFLLIYWVLPNRRLPIAAVLPAAVTTGLLWEVAKRIYIALLPLLDFRSVYGPFSVSVSLMMWAFVSGLLMLAGAHYSASRHALRLAREAGLKQFSDPESDI
ncbi:MAG TPA: YihY/virulence factor BrkB family protein [Terracidiphilus sp.]|jgi:YihY family inner membrane protein